MSTTRAGGWRTALIVLGSAWLAHAGLAHAQIVRPPFDTDYHLYNLGSVPDVPLNYGGMAFLPGDPNTLLIGGTANADVGALYSVGVVRGAGNHITGFAGPATFFSEAAFFDAGIAYGPGGVLFLSRYHPELNMAEIGEQKPGSTVTDKVVDLSMAPLSIPNGPGGLNFVPAGMPGAGQLKLSSYGDGRWYTLDLEDDGAGTFNVTAATPTVTVGSCPEQFVYMPAGTPGFAADSLILTEYCAGVANAYQVDANGDPQISTLLTFVDALPAAEGLVADPMTGDLLFNEFGDPNRVLNVHAYAPLPCTSDADCDDNNVCTDETCDLGTGNCTYVDHDDIPCDDGLFCDGTDTCKGGYCSIHAGNPCAALPNCQDFCFEGPNFCGNTPQGFACTTPDSSQCTSDVCDGSGTCTHPARIDSCRQPFKAKKAQLLIQDNANPKKDNLSWQWLSGSATALGDFGDPLGTTDFELCVFDQVDTPNPVTRFDATVTHGGMCGTKPKPCWTTNGKPPKVKGYRFADKNLLQHGTQSITLTAGADGKAKVAQRARGVNLSPPMLPLNGQVVVQLKATSGQCWGATYSTPTKDTTTLYKAKAD